MAPGTENSGLRFTGSAPLAILLEQKKIKSSPSTFRQLPEYRDPNTLLMKSLVACVEALASYYAWHRKIVNGQKY